MTDFVILLAFLTGALGLLLGAYVVLRAAEYLFPGLSRWLDEHVGSPTPWER